MPRGYPTTGERQARSRERRAARPAYIDPHQFYGAPETAAARDQSPAALWTDVKAGKIRPTKRGKRTMFLGAEIIRANRAEAGLPDEPEAA